MTSNSQHTECPEEHEGNWHWIGECWGYIQIPELWAYLPEPFTCSIAPAPQQPRRPGTQQALKQTQNLEEPEWLSLSFLKTALVVRCLRVLLPVPGWYLGKIWLVTNKLCISNKYNRLLGTSACFEKVSGAYSPECLVSFCQRIYSMFCWISQFLSSLSLWLGLR